MVNAAMSTKGYYRAELFRFLKQLRRHNQRDWFLAHKGEYEQVAREPCLRFIAAFAVPLHEISPWFVADPQPSGGSLFRIYRDVRFSADKSPYKMHIGMHFPHKGATEEVHGPSFYLHLEPDNCFAAAGCWRPDNRSVARIRDAIAWKPDAWKQACRGLLLEGESLTRPPRGYSPQHPLIADLKHKDFVTSIGFSDAMVCSPRFLPDFARACRKMAPLVAFLAKAVGLPF